MFLGVIGYCMKDNGEKHFDFVHHNVSAHDMNEGKIEYAKFGKVGFNNYVSSFFIPIFCKGLTNMHVLG